MLRQTCAWPGPNQLSENQAQYSTVAQKQNNDQLTIIIVWRATYMPLCYIQYIYVKTIPGCGNLPLHQLHHNEVISITAVEEDEAIRGGGFELKEEVHGVVGL